jgi:hypothetical protein
MVAIGRIKATIGMLASEVPTIVAFVIRRVDEFSHRQSQSWCIVVVSARSG